MKKQVSYDGVSDVEYIFSSQFRNYIRDEKLLCSYIDDDDSDIWRICLLEKGQPRDSADSAFLDLLMTVIMEQKMSPFGCSMVQFWKAEEVTSGDDLGERRFIFSTRNQPFLISGRKIGFLEGLCLYRMKMDDIVTGDGGVGGGVIGRVFSNKRIEFSPQIGYFSSEEYPLRDFALSCHIKGFMALPLSDSSGDLIGVLEMVSESSGYTVLMSYLFHESQYESEDESLDMAVFEIEKAVEVVGKRYLVGARTWILCKVCGSLAAIEKSPLSDDMHLNEFFEAQEVCPLKKELEGVVGKAATCSHNLVYCENVSLFSITEYPLSHFARHEKVTSCFGICLKSDRTGSQIYVLELFPNPSKVNEMGLKATLIPILEGLRQNVQTFKVASGEEIGHNLSVLVIDAHSPSKTIMLKHRELDICSVIGTHNIGVCIPYNLPHTNGESSTYETDDPIIRVESSFRDTSTSLVSASTVQSELLLTVKAKFGGSYFMFQLSSSSGIKELSQQVSRKMNLETGTYTLSYLDDDNDPILIVCDDDLRRYILSSLQHEKYTLKIIIKPKYAF